MATIATLAMLNPKKFTISSPPNPTKPTRPNTLLSLQNLPKVDLLTTPSLTTTAIAGAVFSVLSSSDAAFAAQQIADIAESSDNRGLALLLPIVPAIGWVLYNILQPALNQLDKMKSEKGFVVGLGIGGGLAATGWLAAVPEASATDQIGMIADASSSSDSRGLLLLFVVAPAILWVLYNILQPALNQLDKMKSE